MKRQHLKGAFFVEEKETQGTGTQTEKSNLLAKLPAKTWVVIGAAIVATVVIALLAGGRIFEFGAGYSNTIDQVRQQLMAR